MRRITDLRKSPALTASVVTIGNFDGVHLGHQQIIGLAIRKARELAIPSVAFTFRPHPQAFLFPERPLSLLTTPEEKLELLAAQGLDVVVEEPFTAEFAALTPERFFSELLIGRLAAREVVVGYDFAFGKGRQGHLEILKSLCDAASMKLTVVPPFSPGPADAEVVSSSRIRALLQAGDLPAATRLLGRFFSYRGTVVRGAGRGNQLGFPTANIQTEPKLILPYGVYATWAILEGDGSGGAPEKLPAVTNLGVRPTFQRQGDGGQPVAPLVETHLLGTGRDLYDRRLRVEFVRRLREERKFPGVEELRAQIGRDAEEARQILSSHR